MNAVISGRAGVALIVHGDQLFSLDVDEPDELIPRRHDEYHLLIGEGADLEFLEDCDPTAVRQRLELAVWREEALDVSLLLLDPSHSDEVRAQAAEELDECLAATRTLDSLEAILYAAPLPEMADLPGALHCAQYQGQSVLPFLRRLDAEQPSIRAVRQAWDALPQQLFGGAYECRDAMTICLRSGLFRDLARAVANGDSPALPVLQALNVRPELGRFRDALTRWAGILTVQSSGASAADSISTQKQDLHASEVPSVAVDSFLRKPNVLKVNVNAPAVISLSGKSPRRVSGQTLTWLHISDLQFKADGSEVRQNDWAGDKVKESFIADLPKLLGEEDLSPDFVFLTGDVAFSGDDKEYDIALMFLEQLHACLPEPDAPIMVVPGNHDVYRPLVERYQREETAALAFLTSYQATMEYLKSHNYEDDRARVFRRLENFQTFAARCGRFGQPLLNRYGSFITIQAIKGVNVGIAGLNSAWRSSSDADRGRLVLGVPQIDDAVEGLQEAQIRLALVHHPPETDWYILDDMRYQRKTFPYFDFVLRGHEHDPHVQASFFAGREYCHISAGALYAAEHYEKAFNVVRLDLETGAGLVFCWRLSSRTFQWLKDVEIYREGKHFFQVPEKLTARLNKVVTTRATDSVG